MSPAKDFGDHDEHGDQSDKSQDQQAKEDPTMLPEPIEPDDTPPIPEKLIEAPKPAGDARLDVETPSVGQLYAMFPDAMPENTPERRARHLAAVPDLDATDTAALPAGDIEDLDDPWVAAALRWRAVIAFWWRPAATGVAVVAITVIAFFAAGAAVGIAWFIYGAGWTGHSVWTTHGRPNLRQLARAKRAHW
ncbi:hypothetical protein [Nocardia nova]|uniref:hypothetical protein n=1 Tax=Nocardia nova TaxID=37330 RepID=UPI000CEA0D43|nr:hypothetical protein [Nocardia nova]PPI95190.1 hypothetical protein C5E46_19665 [Nocardia nova]